MKQAFTKYGYSKVRDFEKCPAYYNHRWNMGLTPKRVAEAPLFGTVFHAFRQAWYENNKDPDVALRAVHDVMVDYIGREGFDAPTFSMYVLDACYQYMEEYKDDKTERTGYEVDFDTEIGGFPFTGRLDGVVVVDSSVWIDECKTTGVSVPRFIQTMNMDGKTTGYVWAARKITGQLIQGAYLDIIYKKQKKSGFTFHRDVTSRTDHHLDVWEKSTINKLQRIEKCRQEDYWPHHWDACSNMYGNCPYIDLCRFGDRPELIATYHQEGGESIEPGS